MAIKKFGVEEGDKHVIKTKVTVNNKEDLINAALILLRKTQLDAIDKNEAIKDKMSKLNAEFRMKPTFKLLNIVNVWIKGKKNLDNSSEDTKF